MTETHQFENGITLIHKQVPHTKIAHCGFIIGVGSRDENEQQYGIAHFWEHMAFKGTKKRKTFHILNRLDSLGGELNAFTTKEHIVFHASVLDNHFEKALELLNDITFDSIFPEKEITKEKGVIIEEMAYYQDSPSEAIYDQFDELIFGKKHPLGKLILGSEESVNSFEQIDFQKFIRQNMDTERIIFSSVSALPFKKVLKLAEKYIAKVEKMVATSARVAPPKYLATELVLQKNISQAHCLIGTRCFSIHDDRRAAFALLMNLLGGAAMNSRLNLLLREKHGLVYSIETSIAFYSDSGSAIIGFACEKNNLARSRKLILKEIKKLQEKPLGKTQLHSFKQQLIGQLAMGEESNMSHMISMGKAWLDFGKVITIQEIFDDVEKITENDIQELANEIFEEGNLSTLIYEPTN